MSDELDKLLNEQKQGGENPPAPGASALEPNDALAARMDAMALQMEALQQENAQMKATLRTQGVVKGPDPALVGVPYRGQTETLIHPSTGQEVEVKQELLESALAQGFKKITGKKK